MFKKDIAVILRFLTTICVLTFLESIATAGFDLVVAVYHFENTEDSGPRGFDGTLLGAAAIVDNGKIGKCLQLRNEDWFVTLEEHPLGIIADAFSIVAWVKLPRQSDDFHIVLVGTNDDDAMDGAIYLSIQSSGDIKGSHLDSEEDKFESLASADRNVSDNRWHHIAYTKNADTYMLFIDGEVVKTKHSDEDVGFVSDGTFIFISGEFDVNLTGTVFVDEVGFFETGFGVFEIEEIYEEGLTDFLKALPVDPRAKVATTWGEIKGIRW